jgi:hypothetical protein
MGPGGEAVQDLDHDLAAFHGGVVDRTQLLVALPRDVDFVVRVAGVEAATDLGLLLVGELFHAVAK